MTNGIHTYRKLILTITMEWKKKLNYEEHDEKHVDFIAIHISYILMHRPTI